LIKNKNKCNTLELFAFSFSYIKDKKKLYVIFERHTQWSADEFLKKYSEINFAKYFDILF